MGKDMPERVRAVVAKLTKAQIRYVETLRTPDGRGKWPVRNALIDKGLMKPFPHMGPTELCLAVRAHLMNSETTND